jgi:hypothetical protein
MLVGGELFNADQLVRNGSDKSDSTCDITNITCSFLQIIATILLVIQ